MNGTIKLDYLQVFRLSNKGGKQKIRHSQEEPEYCREYVVEFSGPPVGDAKIFVIDNGSYSTMMLDDEY